MARMPNAEKRAHICAVADSSRAGQVAPFVAILSSKNAFALLAKNAFALLATSSTAAFLFFCSRFSLSFASVTSCSRPDLWCFRNNQAIQEPHLGPPRGTAPGVVFDTSFAVDLAAVSPCDGPVKNPPSGITALADESSIFVRLAFLSTAT